MDMKKMLAALDGVESAQGTTSGVAQKGSMKSLLESLDSVVAEKETMEAESVEPLWDLVNEVVDAGWKGDLDAQKQVMYELGRYLDRGTLRRFVQDFRRQNDMDPTVDMSSFADFVNEVEKSVSDELSTPQLVLDELGSYLDGDTIADFVADFRRDYGFDDDMNEGKMSDLLIHDSETMSKEDFTKKHGKEVADEYFESVNEVAAEEELEEAIMVSAEGGEAAELLAILQNAGMSAPAMPAMPEPEMDMQDEYSNSPDEQEMDLDAVIASGDDLHREKDQFPAAADGDNPMKAFEGKFQSILDEMLAEDAEELEEAQSPAQKAAFEKMLAAKKGNKADDKDDEEETDESVEEAVAVNESTEFSDMKHFMQRLNG